MHHVKMLSMRTKSDLMASLFNLDLMASFFNLDLMASLFNLFNLGFTEGAGAGR